MTIWDNVTTDVFIGVGDYTEFRIPLGAYRYCFNQGNFTVCGSGGGTGSTSFQSVIENDNTLSPGNFGPEDSMAVYNITVRFRP